MLYYLISTRTTDCIKIYLYLKNKYDWKKKTNEYYSFTNGEILSAIGYSNNYDGIASARIQCILESLMREGVIKWVSYTEMVNGYTAPKKRLLFVATGLNELAPVE